MFSKLFKIFQKFQQKENSKLFSKFSLFSYKILILGLRITLDPLENALKKWKNLSESNFDRIKKIPSVKVLRICSSSQIENKK